MKPEFVDLRACIYCNEKELRRFRQIVVNCIMATGRYSCRGKSFASYGCIVLVLGDEATWNHRISRAHQLVIDPIPQMCMTKSHKQHANFDGPKPFQMIGQLLPRTSPILAELVDPGE